MLTVLTWVGVAGGALITLGILWKIARALVHIGEAVPTLVTIAEEFRPNEGNSMRDTVDRIEYTVKVNAIRITENAEGIREIREKLAKMPDVCPVLEE
jgi:hypothetical protein